jgi:hypothetical protein
MSEEYEVEKITGKKYVNDRKKYLIKWKGYDKKDSTWEDIKNLSKISDMVDKYDKEFGTDEEESFGKKKRGRPKRNENSALMENAGLSNKNGHSKKLHVAARKRTEKSKSRGSSEREAKSSRSRSDRSHSSCSGRRIKKKRQEKVDLCKDERPQNSDKKIEKKYLEGDIHYDIPKSIIKARKTEDGRKISLFVEWNKRYNGQTPQNSFVNSDEMKEHFSSMLLEFYEDKMKKA